MTALLLLLLLLLRANCRPISRHSTSLHRHRRRHQRPALPHRRSPTASSDVSSDVSADVTAYVIATGSSKSLAG